MAAPRLGELPKKPIAVTKPEPLKEKLRVSGWFTASDRYFKTERDVIDFLEKVRRLSLDKVYVSVWSRGCTFYPSIVLPRLGGPPRCGGFDWLSPMIIEASKLGITLIPWLEWGLHLPAESPLIKSGKISVVEDEMWHGLSAPRINPFIETNREFISELIFEAAQYFSSGEVHLCDNQALKTSQLSKIGKTTVDFSEVMRQSVLKTKQQGIKISAAVLESKAALATHGSNWPSWKQNKIVDELTSELYHLRENPSQFEAFASAEAKAGADSIGIYAGAAGGWDDKQIINFTAIAAQKGLSVSIFELGFFLKSRTFEDIDRLRGDFQKVQQLSNAP